MSRKAKKIDVLKAELKKLIKSRRRRDFFKGKVPQRLVFLQEKTTRPATGSGRRESEKVSARKEHSGAPVKTRHFNFWRERFKNQSEQYQSKQSSRFKAPASWRSSDVWREFGGELVGDVWRDGDIRYVIRWVETAPPLRKTPRNFSPLVIVGSAPKAPRNFWGI